MDRFVPGILMQDYSGGWNPRWSLNATELLPNQSPYMINADYAAKFALTKRRGVTRVGNDTVGSGGITSIHKFLKLDGTEILMRAYGTVHQYLLSGTWTNFQTGLSNNAKFAYKTIGGSVYFGNAVDNWASWDGTTVTTNGANPKGNIYESALTRLFIAGVTAQPQRLYYSSAADPTTFSGGTSGTKDFDSSIASLKSLFDRDGNEQLMVLLTNGDEMFVGFDASGIYVKRVRKNVGSVSHRATEQIENAALVLDIYKNVRSIGYEENQADIRATSKSFYVKDYLKSLTLTNAAGAYADNNYILAVQDENGATNDVELIYSEEYDSWRLYSGHQVNHYTIYQNKVTFASATDLNVYQYDSAAYSDNELPIYFRYDTRALDWDNPMTAKSLRWVKVSGFISTGCDITVKLYKDGDTSSPVFTKTIEGDADYVQPATAYPLGSYPFATQPFSGFGGTSSSIEVRPFDVMLSCTDDKFEDVRLSFENYQKDVDFVITHIKFLGAQEAEDRISPDHII